MNTVYTGQRRIIPRKTMRWYRVDLHMHTPGSSDYQEPSVTFIDILRRAELRGLDAIAFTDHNTVNGYKQMRAEIDQLEMLERLGRATPEERRQLADYQRLLDKILVLPGFEFTATFGFHILGIFAPDTPIRLLEHALLSLNIPPSTLDEGSSIVGASSDVLTSYRTINELGGIVIAAHVNSAHGVAMRGFDFGGQTKIAYTQDPFLHALEVTDFDRRIGGTARFFDGTKSEYPRRMRCVQGSDAHRLARDEQNPKNLGIGDRPTEIQLSECTFESIKEVFQSVDYARTRPYRGPDVEVYDYVQLAREQGANEMVAFHESAQNRSAIVQDICALANGNGGVIYVGCSADPAVPPVGCDNLSRTIEQIRGEALARVTPQIRFKLEPVESSGRVIIRIDVLRGEEQPYAIEDNRIYVRVGAETVIAGRDQIVNLVMSHPPQAAPVRTAMQTAVVTPTFAGVGTTNTSTSATVPSGSQRNRQGSAQRMPRSDRLDRPERSERTEQPSRSNSRFAGATSGMNNTGGRGNSLPPPLVTSFSPEEDDDSFLPTIAVTSPTTSTARPGREPVGAGGAPRTGVEIVGTEMRKGMQHHLVRNLQNGQTVPNVTLQSARDLWKYAIVQRETNAIEAYSLTWQGNVALVRRYRRNNMVRYDLAMRDSNNATTLRTFYGVTDDGLTGPWLQFASDDYPIEEE